MPSSTLSSITIESGVNEEGVEFLHVATISTDGRILLGQLDPATVREQAMQWLEAAEAAEQDAAVLRTIRKLELPEELAGIFIGELRDSRG